MAHAAWCIVISSHWKEASSAFPKTDFLWEFIQGDPSPRGPGLGWVDFDLGCSTVGKTSKHLKKFWETSHPGLWCQGQNHNFAMPCNFSFSKSETTYYTGFAFRIEHRKWNRGRNGLHQLGQPVAPSIIFPVFNPEGEPGSSLYSIQLKSEE